MVNLLLSVVLGMCIWMLIGVISYAVRRGRRDFSSSSQLVATTFDVVCDFSVAGKGPAAGRPVRGDQPQCMERPHRRGVQPRRPCGAGDACRARRPEQSSSGQRPETQRPARRSAPVRGSGGGDAPARRRAAAAAAEPQSNPAESNPMQPNPADQVVAVKHHDARQTLSQQRTPSPQPPSRRPRRSRMGISRIRSAQRSAADPQADVLLGEALSATGWPHPAQPIQCLRNSVCRN